MGFRDNRFYYINNNKEHLLENLAAWDSLDINKKEIWVLEKSIQLQKNREKKVYETLSINEDPIPVNSLYEKIYGKKIETNNGTKENILDQSLRLLNKFFIDMYTIDNRILIQEEEKVEEKPTDAQIIVKRFNEINKYLNIWLEKTDLDTSIINADYLNKIASDSMNFWNEKIKKSLSKDNIDLTLDSDNNIVGIQNYSEEQLKKITSRYKSFANNIFGGLSEAATQFFASVTSGYIIYGTSDINDSQSRITFKNNKNFKDYFKDNEWLKIGDINSEQIKDYQDELKKRQAEICKLHSFREPFFSLNLENVNPKADEIFAMQITNDINPEFLTFGISNKMGHSKSTKINFQNTSLGAMLANVFLSDNIFIEDSDINERGGSTILNEAETIVKAITYTLINEAGILKWDKTIKPIQNTTIDAILMRFTTAFAYIWLTGGEIGKSHADFFLMSKNGIEKQGKTKKLLSANTYFISMSSILEKALKYLKQTTAFFNKVDYTKAIIDEKNLKEIGDLKAENGSDLDNKMYTVAKNTISNISKTKHGTGVQISNYGILLG